MNPRSWFEVFFALVGLVVGGIHLMDRQAGWLTTLGGWAAVLAACCLLLAVAVYLGRPATSPPDPSLRADLRDWLDSRRRQRSQR